MTLFSQFPGQGTEDSEKIIKAAKVAGPNGAAFDAPLDDMGQALATSESVAPEATQDGSAGRGLADGSVDLLDLALRSFAPLGVSMGQPTDTFADFGSNRGGFELVVDGGPSTFVNTGFGDCGCAMCGGGTTGSAEVLDYSDPDAAPGAAASLQTLADYLRVGYWTDTSRNSRWYNVTASGTGANSGTLHYNVTGTPSGGISVSSGTFTDTNGISAARAALVRDAFAFYSELLGINFVETTSTGDAVDIFFIDNQSGAFQSARLHSGTGGAIDHSIVNVASSWQGGESDVNAYTYQTILHEIGHALGLGHQGNYNAGQGTPSYANSAIWANDGWAQSIMSYWDQTENTEFSDDSYARLIGPSAADFIALNNLYSSQGYGISHAFNGDTTYGVGTNITAAQNRQFNDLANLAATNFFTIVDADGIDMVDFSNYNVAQNINLTVTLTTDLRPTFSSVGGLSKNMALAAGTIIEKAKTGGGNDTLTGNQYDNELTGNGGSDILYGGSGIDTLYGGDGNDSLYGGNDGDTLKGGAGADWLSGDAGNDYLKGGAGNDTLFGGTGVDTLQGDAGNDRIVVYTTSTFAGANFLGGADTDVLEVNGSGTFDLRAASITGFEELEFFNNGTDSSKNVYITGAQAIGLGAAALIDGNNNSGSDDRLYIYLSDSGTTTLDLSGWLFQDWVQGGTNTDFLGVYGGAAAETVTGTTRNDYIELDGGADLGYGGNGNDTLKGSAGNDTLYGDAGNDNLQGGTDNDALYAGGGTDSLYGDAGSDVLFGAATTSASLFYGGDGTDSLYKYTSSTTTTNESWYGGDGSDWLVWNNTGVTSTRVVNLATGFITQSGSTNRDVVVGIEHVSVDNGAGIIGDGNDNWLNASGLFANTMDGGAGNDTLKGGGGNDTLRGGTGIDYIAGDEGADTLYDGNSYEGNDSLYGGVGNDTLVKESWTSAAFAKIWDGGDDIDTLDWVHTSNAINGDWVVNLAAGRILYQGGNRDVLTSIENVIVRSGAGIVGDGGANVLTAIGAFANNIAGGDGNDTIDGGDGNDTLYGGTGDDNVTGGAGNDGMEGGAGADYMFGDAGSDVMLGQAGNDTLLGGDDNDFVYGGDDNDWLYGGFGDDLLSGELGNDSLQGDDGNDTVYGGDGDDTLDGWAGDDSLFGDGGADLMHGYTGNDTMTGGGGTDTLFGEDGDDYLFTENGGGLDNFHGGMGTDTVSVAALTQAHNVNLALGTYTVGTNSRIMDSIEVLYLGSGKDTVTGSLGAETLFGGGNADVLYGGGGADVLYGGAGADALYGGDGTSALYGGDGDDLLFIDAGFTGAAIIAGDGGTRDLLNLGAATGPVTVDLVAGTATDGVFALTLTGIEGATGGAFADALLGNGQANQLNGGNGNDTLNGFGGNDTLRGGVGQDVIDGGVGADLIYGGNDADTLIGGNGDDTVYGENGNDRLEGGANNDLLEGGAGADTLIGGTGTDTLIGGAGIDMFVFNSSAEIGLGATSDQVLDFVSGQDKINLSAFATALTFIGTSGFSNTAGELRYYSLGGVGYLAADTTGNGVANFELLFINGASVAAGDLIL